jgi:hypothetical protein
MMVAALTAVPAAVLGDAAPGSAAGGTTYYAGAPGGTPTCATAANNIAAPFSSIQAALNCAAADGTTPARPDTIGVFGLTIENGSSGGEGGGIYNGGSIAIATSDTLSGNSASLAGGGIENAGTFRATNDTFSDNSATRVGGGIWSSGTVVADNDRFSCDQQCAADGRVA